MTLNITVSCPDYVIQASDRRMTRGGEPSSDEANKAVVVQAIDCDFAVTFTGLGELDAKSVDDWIVQVLIDTKAPTIGIDACLDGLRTAASEAFARLRAKGIVEPHTFVIAGWKHFWRANAKIWLVTNCENEAGQMVQPPYDEFELRGGHSAPFQVIITGTEPAVDQETLPRLMNQLHMKLHPYEMCDSVVREIRLAAKHPQYGRYIGTNCMSVTTTWDSTATAMYHPVHGSAVQYAPNFIQTFPGKDGEVGQLIIGGITMGGAVGMEVVLGDSSGAHGGLKVEDRRGIRFRRS